MSVFPWPKERSQRKFVDLIKEADSRWPNWDPPKIILVMRFHFRLIVLSLHNHTHNQAGEFGTIDKKTGEWLTEGNIYTHPDIKSLADQYPLVEKDEPEECLMHSYEVRGKPVPAEVIA
jgi:hypothetical protein